MSRQQFNSYILPKTAEAIRRESDITGIPAGKVIDKAIALYSMTDLNLFNKRLQEHLCSTEEVDLETIKKIKNFLETYINVSTQ
jgi:hypothetical protein